METEAHREIRKLFEFSRDLLCVAGVDGYFKLVNPAFERTLGWSDGELLKRPFSEFVHPDDLDSTVAEVARLSAGEATISFENRYRCADGSYATLRWTAYPDTAAGMMYAAARDVTDIIAAETRFRVLLESLPAAMLLTDEAGTIALANLATATMFGYTDGELVGMSVEDLVPAPLRNSHASKRMEFNRDPGLREMGTGRHLVALRKDGTEFPAEVGLRPIQFNSRPHVVSSVLDLTERKRAEETQKRLVDDLTKALAEIKTLRDLVPMCANCGKIRSDDGSWTPVEHYLAERADVDLSHSICNECGPRLYPDIWHDIDTAG